MWPLHLVFTTVVSQILTPIPAQDATRSKPGATSLLTAVNYSTLLTSVPVVPANQDLYISVTSTGLYAETITIIETTITTITTSDCGCAGPPSNTETNTVSTALPVATTTIPDVTATSTYNMVTTLGLTLCTSRTINPTYTPSTALPINYTWGCPPGTLCHPPQTDCNFEVGLPADTYFCSPDECVPRPELLPAQSWGTNVTSKQIGSFNVSPGYFNLDPALFNLSYSIFNFPSGMEFDYTGRTTKSSHNSSKPWNKHDGAPRPGDVSKTIPGVCYDECNDCALEAQSINKVPALCAPGSAFEILLGYCKSCIDLNSHSRGGSDSITTRIPQFQQFLSYCDTLDSDPSPSQPASSSASSTTSSYTTQASQTISTSDPPAKSSLLNPIPTSTQSTVTLSTYTSSQSTTSIPSLSLTSFPKTSTTISSLTSVVIGNSSTQTSSPSSASQTQAPEQTTRSITSVPICANPLVICSDSSVVSWPSSSSPIMTSMSLTASVTATESSSGGGHNTPSATSSSGSSHTGGGSKKATLNTRYFFLTGLLLFFWS